MRIIGIIIHLLKLRPTEVKWFLPYNSVNSNAGLQSGTLFPKLLLLTIYTMVETSLLHPKQNIPCTPWQNIIFLLLPLELFLLCILSGLLFLFLFIFMISSPCGGISMSARRGSTRMYGLKEGLEQSWKRVIGLYELDEQ